MAVLASLAACPRLSTSSSPPKIASVCSPSPGTVVACSNMCSGQDAIERYIKAHNKTSMPFVWTASASAIFEKLTKIPVPPE